MGRPKKGAISVSQEECQSLRSTELPWPLPSYVFPGQKWRPKAHHEEPLAISAVVIISTVCAQI